MNNEVLDPHLTTKIVASYVRHHRIGADQVSELITSVHRALSQLGQPVQPQEVLTPAVSVRRSVQHDYVVCLNCGYRGKALRRHISTRHGLSRDRLPEQLGIEARSSTDRSQLFRAAFNAGKGTRAWSQALEAHAETQHPFRIEIRGWSSAAADQE